MSISTPPSSLVPLLSSTISTISLLLAASSGFLFPSSFNLLETKLILSSTGKVLRQGVGIWGSCAYGEPCTFQSPFSSPPPTSSHPQSASISTLPFAGTLFVLLLLALLASSIQNFINLFVFLSPSSTQPPSTSSPAKKLSRDVGLLGGALLGVFISLLAYPSISLHWSSLVGEAVLGSVQEQESWRAVGPGSGASLVVLAGLLLVWGGRERGSASCSPLSPNDLESSAPIEKQGRSSFVDVEELRSS